MSCCKKHTHKFRIRLQCNQAGCKDRGAITVDMVRACRATSGVEFKRIGCRICRLSYLMLFYCYAGQVDVENSFPEMTVSVENKD